MHGGVFTAVATRHNLLLPAQGASPVATRREGTAQSELIETAKRDLIETVTSNDNINQEAARVVADDLAHARLLQEHMALASEHLTASNLEEAALVMRAAAAYSTAIKNISDMLRHSLRTDRVPNAVEADDVPELVVVEFTDEVVLPMRQERAAKMDLPPPSPPTVLASEKTVEATGQNERVSEGEDDPA